MKNNYLCDIVKVILAIFGFIVFATLVCACLLNGRYIHAVVFIAFAAIYAFLMVRNLAVIHIDDDHVEKRIFGKTKMSFSWEEIKDVGLVHKKFIYFSREEMTDSDKQRMCFNWPPTDKIYFRAGRKAIKEVERQWNRREKLFVNYQSGRFHSW